MRVLIIDDNPLDIELVSRTLQKKLGAKVESVHTAEDGWRRLQVESFDVILVDYCLPGQNGIDFLREIKAADNTTPVLLVTARGDTRIMEVAKEAGAADYISKDESLTPALYRAVEAAAERGRATRAIHEREQAEKLRHDAEKIITALEQRVEHLEGALGSRGLVSDQSPLDALPAEERAVVHDDLVNGYARLLRRWRNQPGDPEVGHLVSELVADCFHYQLDSSQLLGLHRAACEALRPEPQTPTTQKGCSPKMLLLEISLALMEAYRRAALSRKR